MRVGVCISSYQEYRILEAVVFKNIKHKEVHRNNIKKYYRLNVGCKIYVLYYEDITEYSINTFTKPLKFRGEYISFREYLNLYFQNPKNVVIPLMN